MLNLTFGYVLTGQLCIKITFSGKENIFVYSSCCINLLSNFFFADEAEDDDANKEYIEEANRDAVMIAAAKLVANDKVSKVKLACVVYILNGKFHPVRLESCVVWQVVLCYPSILLLMIKHVGVPKWIHACLILYIKFL